MTCYYPLDGWRSRSTTEAGKRKIVFDKSMGYEDQPVQVPCSKCIGCRIDKSREWAVRCYHEIKMHKSNVFLTLTYRDEDLPEKWSLQKDDLKKFRRRMKHHAKTNDTNYMFFACGEYSPEKKRPHYHMIIFGYWPDDAKYLKKTQRGDKLYTSEEIDKLWKHGDVYVGEANEKSAGYVARYLVKKQYIGEKREVTRKVYDWLGIEEEFLSMTTQPPIGKKYWQKYRSEGRFKHDFIIVEGKKRKPPRMYDKLEEQESIKHYRRMKGKRIREAKEVNDNTLDRLRVKEEILIDKSRFFQRKIDND